MFQAIGFDFDHTLGYDRQLERRVLLDMLRHERPAARPERSWEPLVDAALAEYRSGHLTQSAMLHRLFAHLDPLPDERHVAALIETFLAESVARLPESLEPVPGARELLARLTEMGVPTAILTNGWSPLQQRKAELLGYTGTVLVSDDLGVRKPDPRAFAALAAALRTPAEGILYVGDSPETDIVGARSAGMGAAWLASEGQVYDVSLPPPNLTIHALGELLTVVPSLLYV